MNVYNDEPKKRKPRIRFLPELRVLDGGKFQWVLYDALGEPVAMSEKPGDLVDTVLRNA